MTEEREAAFYRGETEWMIMDGVQFAFDPHSLEFVFTAGGQETRVNDPDDHESRTMVHQGGGKQEGIVLTPHGLVLTPDFRRRLISLERFPDEIETLERRVSLAMEGAWKKQDPDYDKRMDEFSKMTGIPRPASPDLSSFRVRFIPNAGTLDLQVPGQCACLGPIEGAMGVYTRAFPRSWQERTDLPVGLTPHNNDTPIQRISLLAGAGATTWILEGRQSYQGELDLFPLPSEQ